MFYSIDNLLRCLLYFLINYKFKFAKTSNSIVFNIIIATILIAFYKEQKILLLIDKNQYISSNCAKDFRANKLILFDYKFYKEQTTIRKINLYI